MNLHKDMHVIYETPTIELVEIPSQFMLSSLFTLLFILYISAMVYTNRRYKRWPIQRTIFWALGILCAIVAVAGPLANRSHSDFTVHMVSHLLLGMIAPLLMAAAAPMTLLLRTVSTRTARMFSWLLRSWLSRIYTHPFVATTLNIGGLWLLYTTELYSLMHDNSLMYLIVHLHIFITGYLFTISMIYFDPIMHRKSLQYRMIFLILALAGHGILSKYIYAHPPIGVPLEQAEIGSKLMYYGGDIIDAALIFLLCMQWYKSVRTRTLTLQ